MFYFIRHSTRFRYSDPVRQSVMEVMMQPRSEGNQSVRQFELSTDPRARIMARRDFLGNIVHHFDIPGSHSQLSIIAEGLVEVHPTPRVPQKLEGDAWKDLDDMVYAGDYWDFLMPSKFSRPTQLLKNFATDMDVVRRDDPLSLVRELNTRIYESFNYVSQFTTAESPIDDALSAKQGVCQDFAHIMIALLREIGIPTRYVSGYLFHRRGAPDRSTTDATHAWVEVLLPGLNWVGFDPTNNLVCGERHIRTAVGRDYDDVPPTHGIYRGRTRAELRVAVHVMPADAPKPEQIEPMSANPWVPIADSMLNLSEDMEGMAQQQQQ